MRTLKEVDLNCIEDLTFFFQTSYTLAEQFPNDHVIKFSINLLKEKFVSTDLWDQYFSLLMKTALNYPTVTRDVFQIIWTYFSIGHNMNLDIIHDVCSAIILKNLNL
jgi:hypothetical protein